MCPQGHQLCPHCWCPKNVADPGWLRTRALQVGERTWSAPPAPLPQMACGFHSRLKTPSVAFPLWLIFQKDAVKSTSHLNAGRSMTLKKTSESSLAMRKFFYKIPNIRLSERKDNFVDPQVFLLLLCAETLLSSIAPHHSVQQKCLSAIPASTKAFKIPRQGISLLLITMVIL